MATKKKAAQPAAKKSAAKAAKSAAKKTAVKKTASNKKVKYVYSWGAGKADGNGRVVDASGATNENFVIFC